MKKTMTMAGIAVLALMMVMGTCSLFEPEAEMTAAPPVYDAQGRLMIPISILTGGEAAVERSMNLDISRVALNYYEVLFQENGEYFRAAGVKGKILTVYLPDGFELDGTAENAIAFGGYWDREVDDYTLLATAHATHINHGMTPANGEVDLSANTGTISPATRTIRFELYAVETEFLKASTASFKIISPSLATSGPHTLEDYAPTRDSGGGRWGFDSNNTTGAAVNSFNADGQYLNRYYTLNAGTKNERRYPFWRLPSHREGIGLDYSKDPPAALQGEPIKAEFTYGVKASHEPGIVVYISDISEGYEFASWAVVTKNAEDGVTAVDAELDLSTAALPGQVVTGDVFVAPFPSGGTFKINISTYESPVHMGYCLLIPNIPVKAMTHNPEAVSNHRWMLRNGLFDYFIHDHNDLHNAAGYTTDPADALTDPSLGGALLLCVGEPVSSGGREIEIIFGKEIKGHND